MKKLTALMLAGIIGMFSISFVGCGPGKAKDAKADPAGAKKAEDESKKKTEEGGN